MHTRQDTPPAWEVDRWLHLQGRQVPPAQQGRVTSVHLSKLSCVQIRCCGSTAGMGYGSEAEHWASASLLSMH